MVRLLDSFLRCGRDWEYDLLLLLYINSPCLQIGTLIKTLNLALESLREWMSGRKVSSTTRPLHGINNNNVGPWHSRDSNPWLWLWYHLSDRELCHSTSKSIGDEENTLKSFMEFDITPRGPVFKVVVGS